MISLAYAVMLGRSLLSVRRPEALRFLGDGSQSCDKTVYHPGGRTPNLARGAKPGVKEVLTRQCQRGLCHNYAGGQDQASGWGGGKGDLSTVRHCPFCTLVDKTSGEFGDARVHLQVTRQDDEPQGEGCSTVVLRLFL